jgi:hypothetical protein
MLYVAYGHFGMLMGRKGIVFGEKAVTCVRVKWLMTILKPAP